MDEARLIAAALYDRIADTTKGYEEDRSEEGVFYLDGPRRYSEWERDIAAALGAVGAVAAFGPPSDERVEAAAKLLFDMSSGPAHTWDGIEDPGRDLWRHNARAILAAGGAS